ncbi:MAG TPA: hypothetical protein PK664_00230 [Paludibacteraceae bacterium]|nr:hypothetical protein [Paludibacteraceae bacterium]
MKKVFQIKLKSITRVFAMVMAISLVTFTGCKTYDADIDKLNTDLASLKTDLTALNTSTQNALTVQITQLNTDLTALKARVKTLEDNGATDAEVAAVKADIMSKVVTLEAFNAYKATVTADIAALTTKVNAAATKAELTALETAINAKIVTIEGTLTALGAKVTTLQGDVTTINTKLNNLGTIVDGALVKIDKNTADIAALKADVEARLAIVEGILNIQNGKSVVIEDIKAQLADHIAKINANATAIAKLIVDLNAVDARLKALEALNIAKRLGDLEAKDIVLQGQIDAIKLEIQALKDKNAAQDLRMNGLEARIVALEKFKTDVLTPWMAAIDTWKTWADAEIKDLRADVEVLNANMKVMANAMHLNFEALSNRLSSLTYIPTFHVNGIPAINFSPLIAHCDTITPSVVMSYHLNPSFIGPEDIETNNLAFAIIKSSNINGALWAPAAVQQVKAIFKEIKDGKIYVSVKVEDYMSLLDSSFTTYTGYESFKMIALQVPLSDKAVKENALEFDKNGGVTIVNDTEYPTDRVITGEYVRLYHRKLYSGNIDLSRKDLPALPDYNYKETYAKNLPVLGVDGATASSPLVVNLPYGQTLDLIDKVIPTMFNDVFPFADYGLKFKFDLKQANGTDDIVYNRGTNNTDQQQFINISDAAKGTINAKTFSIPEIVASQGRTPIVRVVMYSENPYCPIAIAFIKVLIEDKPRPVVPPVTFEWASQTGPCADVVSVLTVQQMNEKIYTAANLSKEEFHAIYPSALFTTSGDPLVKEIYHPDGQQTDSYLLNWTLTATQIWNKLATSNPANFAAQAIYKPTIPSQYPDIVINFKRSFTRPATTNIPASKLIANYWYGDYTYVKHNIVVPQVGQTNGTLALFSNNINQAFEQTAGKKLNVGLSNYEYFFWSEKIGNVLNANMKLDDGTVLTVNSTGNQLMFNGDVVATINPYATNVGDVLVLNQGSAKAKELLNKGTELLKARIGIRTLYCPDMQIKAPVTVNGKNYFDVVFVRPINPQPAEEQHFVDALNFGDPYTYLEIAKLTNLNDWRFPDPVASFATHANYWQYYGVTNITANVANIKTDLNQAAGVKVPVTNYPDLKVAYAATVPGVTPPTTNFFGYLTYDNTGNTLGKLFNLYVPVTITYSWGTIQSAEVVVPVWKTVGQSGIKRK